MPSQAFAINYGARPAGDHSFVRRTKEEMKRYRPDWRQKAYGGWGPIDTNWLLRPTHKASLDMSGQRQSKLISSFSKRGYTRCKCVAKKGCVSNSLYIPTVVSFKGNTVDLTFLVENEVRVWFPDVAICSLISQTGILNKFETTPEIIRKWQL